MTRLHRTACVLSVGDELVLGQALDTNSNWISERLGRAGVRVVEHATVPDDLETQSQTITRLARSADLVIATGGLGPTKDDLTRHALAAAMGDELVEDEESLAFLHGLERERGREMTPERRAQALRPARGRSLANDFGSAPGLFGIVHGVEVFCLPGPPREMRPMFEAHVLPGLRPDPAALVATRVLRTWGLAEADAGAMLGDLMDRGGATEVGTTASGGIVSVRMRAHGADRERLLDKAERAVRERLGDAVFGGEDDTLASLALRLLIERGERMTVAESCTGGLLGAALTAVPGSSSAFDGGFLTYANEAKRDALGVPMELIENHGAVSAEVVRAMAEGALATDIGAGSDHALAISGVAGPDGGTDEKPVGTVYIGYAQRGEPTLAKRFLIAGDRDDVRARSVTTALGMLTLRLRGVEWERPLLWEIVG